MSQADRLREFFLNRDCPGIAKLVAYLAENPDLREIGSSSWIDNERVLDEITLAMRKYGFPHLPAYLAFCDCGEHSEWHKHLYIGGRIPPLDWLMLFSMNVEKVSQKALSKFDRGCGGFVETSTAPSHELTREELLELFGDFLEKAEHKTSQGPKN
jgi:hypothetical protein